MNNILINYDKTAVEIHSLLQFFLLKLSQLVNILFFLQFFIVVCRLEEVSNTSKIEENRFRDFNMTMQLPGVPYHGIKRAI